MTLEKFNVPPITLRRADEILEHINVERWVRPAELLRLVAYVSTWPQFAPIRRSDIVSMLGRTPRQAKHDHEVMCRLAEQRILQRVPRRTDLWRVNPDLRHWVGVPGIPSWRSVVDIFLGSALDNCARVGPNAAGQSTAVRTATVQFEPGGEGVLSVTNLPRRARDWPRRARPPGETPPEKAPTRAEPGAPHYAFRSTTYFSHSLKAREGVSEHQQEAAKRLLAAVSRTVVTAIFGAPRDRIEAIGIDHAHHIDALISRLPAIAGLKTGTGVAQAIEGLAAELGARSSSDPAKRIATLRSLMATDPESPRIDEWRAELEDLGGV